MEPLAANKTGLKWMSGVCLLFATIASISVALEFFWIFILPVVMLITILGIYRLDLMMLLGVVITPLSINFAKTSLGIGVSLPSEPLMFATMLLFTASLIHNGGIERKILYHPVSIAIIFHLVWMIVTTLSSSMPLVSFKQTLARFCFVMVYFYLGILVFREKKMINVFTWCYLITLTVVIIYTTYTHALSGFTEKAAHTAMVPFYNDHTAYAALVAMFIPMLFVFLADWKNSNLVRWISLGLIGLFITAIVLSYTRASWVSLVAALVCFLVFALRIRTWIVVIGIAVVVFLFFMFQTTIIMNLEQNEKQSSTDFAAHVQSISNISTDASNVERLNRWQCAFRMFHERPFFGWGPGTYMFQYAPFQKWSEKTIISTNFGEAGNAHSEYIGPLAEQGVLGSVAFILILIAVVYRGSRIIIHARNRQTRMIARGLLLGLITYWVHGMLNNFLDTEKASVPFWGFIGAIVALDIFHRSETDNAGTEISTAPNKPKA